MSIESVCLTEKGIKAEILAKRDKKNITFTRFIIGDKYNPEPEKGNLASTNTKGYVITSIENISNKMFRVRCNIDNRDFREDFEIKELALMCTNPAFGVSGEEKEIAYCLGTTVNGEIIPSKDKGNLISHIFELDVRVSGNLANFVVDDTAKADLKTVEELSKSINAEGFVINTKEKFNMWANNAEGHDYSVVKILAGNYDFGAPINLTATQTKYLEGFGKVKINADLKYDSIPTDGCQIANISLGANNSFINCKNLIDCNGIMVNCKNVISRKDSIDITGDVRITGDLYQTGERIQTSKETILLDNDMIVTRGKSKEGLVEGEFSGIRVGKYDGIRDGVMAINNHGEFVVGSCLNNLVYKDRSGNFFTDKEMTMPAEIPTGVVPQKTGNTDNEYSYLTDKQTSVLITREKQAEDKGFLTWNEEIGSFETKKSAWNLTDWELVNDGENLDDIIIPGTYKGNLFGNIKGLPEWITSVDKAKSGYFTLIVEEGPAFLKQFITFAIETENGAVDMHASIRGSLSKEGNINWSKWSFKNEDAKTADFAKEAGHAKEADVALKATNVDLAKKAYNADNATNADKAKEADHAAMADNASKASLAENATHAVDADNAKNAKKAEVADTANNALGAANATNANNALNADRLGNELPEAYVKFTQAAGVKVDNAANADNATFATKSNEANHATNADNSLSANDSLSLGGVEAALYAKTEDIPAIKVNNAINADEATHAVNSDEAIHTVNADAAISDSEGHNLAEHINNTNNPHGVTLDQIGAIGFKSEKAIPGSSNIDDYTTPGQYYCYSTEDVKTLTGIPKIVNTSFDLLVFNAIGTEDYKVQIIKLYNKNDLIIRTYDAHALKWLSWEATMMQKVE